LCKSTNDKSTSAKDYAQSEHVVIANWQAMMTVSILKDVHIQPTWSSKSINSFQFISIQYTKFPFVGVHRPICIVNYTSMPHVTETCLMDFCFSNQQYDRYPESNTPYLFSH